MRYLASAFICTALLFAATPASVTSQWAGFGYALKSGEGQLWSPTYHTVADFDRDGVLDLAVGYRLDLSVGIVRGKGDGTFHPVVGHKIGARTRAIASGDLNGDGKPDVVTAHGEFSQGIGVSVLLGNGDGTLRPVVAYSLAPGASQAAGVTLGDFNADGRPDVAVLIPDNSMTSAIESGINVFLNRGDGTLAAATSHPLEGQAGFNSSDFMAFTAADFNGDGKPDLLTPVRKQGASGTVGDILVLPGKGDGSFGEAARTATAVPLLQGVVADFNHDGRLDMAGSDFRSLTIYLGVGDGTFREGAKLDGQGLPAAAGDFDGDGKLDLLLSFFGFVGHPNTARVALGNGDGTFSLSSESRLGSSPFAFSVGDFNYDGRLDFVTSYDNGAFYVSVSLNSVIVPEPCQDFKTETVLTDPGADATRNEPSRDIQSVSIGERLSADGTQVMVFTIKVASMATFSGLDSWAVSYDLPYRSGAVSARSIHGRIEFAHPESNFTADGTITIVVPRIRLDIGPGERMTNIRAWTDGVVSSEDSEIFDVAPGSSLKDPSPASYTPGGTRPCAAPTSSPTPTPTPTPAAAPVLLMEEGTENAVALDSVTLTRGPFAVHTEHNFAPDLHTRLLLFATLLDLLPGEDASAVTARAEDSQGRVFPLTVEHVGKVPGSGWLTQVVVRLPDELEAAGDVRVSVSLRGAASNKAVVNIQAGVIPP
ncbi:MAG TPA: FG-GAP-like repeat-containing protein [Pyrinomonadaceae bacterium]